MGLSDKLAARRVQKEQKQAERQLVKAGTSGREIVASLRSDKSQIDLELVHKTAEIFNGAGDKKEVLDTLLDKPHFKAMYAMVREQLEGDWMADFQLLLAQVSPIHKMQAQVVSWDQWRGYGDAAGLDEKGLAQALQVIVIFRKAFDRNKLAKPKR